MLSGFGLAAQYPLYRNDSETIRSVNMRLPIPLCAGAFRHLRLPQVQSMRTMKYSLANSFIKLQPAVLFTALALVTQTTQADIFAYSEAKNGAGTILVSDSQLGQTSAVANFNIVDTTSGNSYLGFSAGNQTSIGTLNTLKFQLQTDATVPAVGHIETLSTIAWEDAMISGIAGSAAELHFTVDGDIQIIDPSVRQNEQWNFSASGLDSSGFNTVSASILADDLDGNGIPRFTPVGWKTFDTSLTDSSLSGQQFRGEFVVPITVGSQFSVDFTGLAFVDGSDGSVQGNLMNSMVLTSVTDSAGVSLRDANFSSGLKFTSVPEPSGGIVLFLLALSVARNRRRRLAKLNR